MLAERAFRVLPQGTCVTAAESPAHGQFLASVCEHAARHFWYVAFGSDLFVIRLTSGGLVIYRIFFFKFQLSFHIVTSFRVPALAPVVRRTRDCDVRRTPMPHKGPQVSERRLVCRPPSPPCFRPFLCEAFSFQNISMLGHPMSICTSTPLRGFCLQTPLSVPTL